VRRSVLALKRTSLAAALLIVLGWGVVGCGGSPTSPTSERPAVIALSGQSNAVLLKPALSKYATVVGASLSGAPMSFWAVDGPMWSELAPTLSPQVSRFVWFQGESDADFGTPGAPRTSAYAAELRDLVARVRALTRPNLFVIICGLTNARANQTEFDIFRGEQQRFVATDPNAAYVSTIDLPNDGQHLTSQGYEQLAVRIVETVAPADLVPQRVPPVLR
jgi:hypothetical protein